MAPVMDARVATRGPLGVAIRGALGVACVRRAVICLRSEARGGDYFVTGAASTDEPLVSKHDGGRVLNLAALRPAVVVARGHAALHDMGADWAWGITPCGARATSAVARFVLIDLFDCASLAATSFLAEEPAPVPGPSENLNWRLSSMAGRNLFLDSAGADSWGAPVGDVDPFAQSGAPPHRAWTRLLATYADEADEAAVEPRTPGADEAKAPPRSCVYVLVLQRLWGEFAFGGTPLVFEDPGAFARHSLHAALRKMRRDLEGLSIKATVCAPALHHARPGNPMLDAVLEAAAGLADVDHGTDLDAPAVELFVTNARSCLGFHARRLGVPILHADPGLAAHPLDALFCSDPERMTPAVGPECDALEAKIRANSSPAPPDAFSSDSSDLDYAGRTLTLDPHSMVLRGAQCVLLARLFRRGLTRVRPPAEPLPPLEVTLVREDAFHMARRTGAARRGTWMGLDDNPFASARGCKEDMRVGRVILDGFDGGGALPPRQGALPAEIAAEVKPVGSADPAGGLVLLLGNPRGIWGEALDGWRKRWLACASTLRGADIPAAVRLHPNTAGGDPELESALRDLGVSVVPQELTLQDTAFPKTGPMPGGFVCDRGSCLELLELWGFPVFSSEEIGSVAERGLAAALAHEATAMTADRAARVSRAALNLVAASEVRDGSFFQRLAAYRSRWTA
jgi:hypothetical protein